MDHRAGPAGPPASPSCVVALDGPAGSGKSTVARRVARALGWRYVDTGATYRAVTLAVLRAGVDPTDSARVIAVAQAARIRLCTDPEHPGVTLDDGDVAQEVRGHAVTAAVSAVSAVPQVRALLLSLQREAIGQDGAVAEGRDVAGVVVPDAAVKIYLDADPAVRAARRAAEPDAGVEMSGAPLSPEEPGADEGELPVLTGERHAAARREAVAVDLARRDAFDSGRVASPLRAADGAVHLDSTALGIDEVVAQVLALVAAAGLAAR